MLINGLADLIVPSLCLLAAQRHTGAVCHTLDVLPKSVLLKVGVRTHVAGLPSVPEHILLSVCLEVITCAYAGGRHFATLAPR